MTQFRISKLWLYLPHLDFTYAVFDKGGKEVFRSIHKPECEKFIEQNQ